MFCKFGRGKIDLRCTERGPAERERNDGPKCVSARMEDLTGLVAILNPPLIDPLA
jgi:hypothetical protein